MDKPKRGTISDLSKPGWMSPDGIYYPVNFSEMDWAGRLHFVLAKHLTDTFYPGQAAPFDDHAKSPQPGPQAYLMLQGWLRIDSLGSDFMRRPTANQHQTLQAIYQRRLDNPSAITLLDYRFYEQLQEICNWLGGDPTGDYEEFEERVARHA